MDNNQSRRRCQLILAMDEENSMCDDRLVRLGETLKITGFARSTWYAGIKMGYLPRPVHLGGRQSAWSLQTLSDFVGWVKAGNIPGPQNPSPGSSQEGGKA
jgi:predicted DNA-binding transcriptional regulator AlpA